MARRTVLPTHVKESLNDRCLWGSGLDDKAMVLYKGMTIPSEEAVKKPLSDEMKEQLLEIRQRLYDDGAIHVTIHKDPRRPECRGAVQILWIGDIEPFDVADRIKISTNEAGLPCIPSWISLRAENNFDLRWQSKSMGENWF